MLIVSLRCPADSSADAKPKEAIPETHKSAYASIAKGKRQKWAKWSSEEDTQLAALVKEHGSLNWIFIASLMPSDPATGSQRSHDSCQARWNHYLCKKEEYQDWAEEAGVRSPSEGAGDEPSSRKMSKEDAEKARGAFGLPLRLPLFAFADLRPHSTARARANAASSRWMPNDDDQLIRLKEENPTKSWAWLGDQLEPKRSAGSCRARWAQQITKNDEQKKERKARKDGAHNESIVAAAATLVAKNQRQASRQSKGKEVEQQDAQEPSAASSEASGSPSAVTKPAAPLVVAEAAEGGEAATKAVEKAVEEEVIEEEMTDAEVSGVRIRARRGKATSAAPPPTKAKKVTRRAQVWTPAEEQHLRDLVAEHGTKDWATTARSLGTGRTPASVAARWHRLQSSSQEQRELATFRPRDPRAPS
ncbi:hypothetical protein BCR35DRAFT_191638 [Leucosporidium creatinivorum]|uniref:Homeodomain-like protein n=1 Tax=Leucosporidium creatinivorum TaxID=106004 RepID=A0A1Y2FYD4_9BASI|nr:hypothetical protein BCR35DRAFT_191638 [Leucosporidium creatinivorum]